LASKWQQPMNRFRSRGMALADRSRRSSFSLCVLVPLRYNSCMENNDWFRNDLLLKYEAGVWVLLIVVAAGILGLIFWLSYQLS
jgi:hypothetical protein